MADIYTKEWYDSLRDILNRSEEVTKNAPPGRWHVLAEITGDGKSPYISQGEVKRFTITFLDGKCVEYQERHDEVARKDFDFILQLPASLFERVVADQADPVEAGLKGEIKITGDMRILIQNASLVNVLSGIYSKQVQTSWPKGSPPYQ